jgi:Fe2+ transport system protein FeoA
MDKVIVLSDLASGKKGRIKEIECQGPLKKKLLDMGVIPGTEVEVLKVAPLGDPIDVKVKGYQLSLRKEEAKHITITV